METLTISNRFFRHELNNYSNWRTAFWREFIQNSVDANSRNIRITIKDSSLENSPEDRTTAIVEDDGPGMTEATLRDVYFQLGETTKTHEDSIGGHGRARILTCFAHESYSIRTQNLLCNGHGGQYQIENNHPFHPGCIVQVELTASKFDDLQGSLENYLQTCQLPCNVEINGAPYTNWLYRRQATRVISFGTLHISKKESNRLFARVKGVTMFTQYLDCEVGVILEIDHTRARDLLPVSRDNLKYEQAMELQKLSAEIAIDHKSIKRDCLENRTEIFGKLKPFKKKSDLAAEEEERQEAIASLAQGVQTTWHGGAPDWSDQAAAHYGGPGNSQTIVIPEEPNPLPDLALHFEDAPKSLISASKRFERDKISGTRLKMLRAWEASVIFFLERVAERHYEAIQYLPGFVFSTGNRAMHVPQPGGGHLLLINPLDENGNLSFSIHDYEKLFALGLHECTHVLCRAHNEEFASIQTQLTEECLPEMSQFKSRIQLAIAKEKTVSKDPEQTPLPA